MTRTFEEMCKARDPLYAATLPQDDFVTLKTLDRCIYITSSKQRRRWYTLRRNRLTREIQDRVKSRNDAR